MKIKIERYDYPLHMPFAITGQIRTVTETVRVTLTDGATTGRGEGVGVPYMGETAETMLDALMGVREAVEAGITLADVQALLPPSGARNALDCALWDLTLKKHGQTVWQHLKLAPKRLQTVYTIGIESADRMAEIAAERPHFNKFKIKLSGEQPIEKLEAVRKARPDADMIVDVNQGWSFEELVDYAPQCAKLGVRMLEQPLPRGSDEALEGYAAPLPIGGDESCLHSGEFDVVKTRYDVFNIKLDKTGGLTDALALAQRALADGKALMVGNMTGTSLSMAPAFVIGQSCDYIDLDGPLLIKGDIDPGLTYSSDGWIDPPTPAVWG